MLLWILAHKYLFESLFSILLDTYLGMKLLSQIVISCLVFWGTTKLFSVAVPFYILSSNVWVFHEEKSVKESAWQCRRQKTQIQSLQSGRSPGLGSGNPLQFSCPGNPMDREVWKSSLPTVHGVTKSQTQLSNGAQVMHTGSNISTSCPRLLFSFLFFLKNYNHYSRCGAVSHGLIYICPVTNK